MCVVCVHRRRGRRWHSTAASNIYIYIYIFVTVHAAHVVGAALQLVARPLGFFEVKLVVANRAPLFVILDLEPAATAGFFFLAVPGHASS
jgi:hypothetical protein